ncbi:DUF1028 domain-containing protein [Aquimarina sp. 2-A2]|uniref:DUF1028 domain-containing protein n=1 Tax=Aquimarina sp. 2-A2 TaxID=3382644 RepID=UPI00387F26EC
MNKATLTLLLILTTSFFTNCHATWSIIAVDRQTGQIGVVGASCTFDVSGIASIVPGKGAVVVQAASDYFARMKGVELMYNGTSLNEILLAMKDAKFRPEKQQIGLILLDATSKPVVYSGFDIAAWSGEAIGSDFAVMGNILTDQTVISNAYKAFNENRDKPFAERLMLALKAGEESGGDKRCEKQYARSAFIMIYQPKHDAILKLAVQGIKKGGKRAVTLLNKQFKACTLK